MQHITILGGGFAGLSAARRLARIRGLEVTLIDPRPAHQFLPLLPDIIGRDFRTGTLSYPLVHAAERWAAQVVNAEAHDIDLEKRRVHCAGGAVSFDYLLLAAGAKTTFFNQPEIRRHALALDSIDDASRIVRTVCHHSVGTIVVCGAGYTGIEIATNLWRLFDRRGLHRRIILTDLAQTPIPGLPTGFQLYVAEQLEKLDIDFLPGTTVAAAAENEVELKDGTHLRDAVLIWAAGVETPDVVQQLPVDKTKQGRIRVDADLSFAEGCYAAGDTAGFMHEQQVLRPSVQFAISEGAHAAGNIKRAIAGKPPTAFKPFDPGYVVPLGHGRGCGAVLGKTMTGRTPHMLHYLMCCLRSYGLANRGALIADLYRSGRPSR